MTIVKICGLSEPVSLDAALEAGADMVGFVFFERSPRNVSLKLARALRDRVERRATIVALTVDADDATIAAILAALEPEMIQCHGRESPERVGALRARFGVPVMRAVGLAEAADMGRIAAFDAVADYLLFDARPPVGADRPGGNGEAFDWTLLRGLTTRSPWLLAGGLHEANVGKALTDTGAPGLDVSSGVESRPGIKDPTLIARFVASVRTASPTLGSIASIG